VCKTKRCSLVASIVASTGAPAPDEEDVAQLEVVVRGQDLRGPVLVAQLVDVE
jgi:hypothetical protein